MLAIFKTQSIIIIDMEVLNFDLIPEVLVQFSARKFNNNNLVSRLDILINEPYLILDSKFIERTRITPNLLRQRGISYSQALTKIQSFIGNDTLVTYKGNFYYLQLLWNMFDNKLKNPTIDIIDLCRNLEIINGDPDNISLEDLALSFNLDFDHYRWHNASYDVSIIEKIWFKLKSLAKEKK